MKNSQALSAERARELFSYDPLTGLVTWKVSPSNNVPGGTRAGSDNGNGYLRVRVDDKLCYVHRLAWLLQAGEWPDTVDHINGIRSDNRWVNLRSVPKAVNNQNQRPRGRDLPMGVQANGSGFTSKLTSGGVQKYLGYFGDPEQAHQAYLKAKRELHVGCTI